MELLLDPSDSAVVVFFFFVSSDLPYILPSLRVSYLSLFRCRSPSLSCLSACPIFSATLPAHLPIALYQTVGVWSRGVPWERASASGSLSWTVVRCKLDDCVRRRLGTVVIFPTSSSVIPSIVIIHLSLSLLPPLNISLQSLSAWRCLSV